MATLPITQCYVGIENRGEDTRPDLALSIEVGALLYTEGFWSFCREKVTVRDRYVFNGPFEEGRIEADEIESFVAATEDFSRRYEGEGLIHGVYSGTDEAPHAQVVLSKAELSEGLAAIKLVANEAKSRKTFLYVVT